MRHNFKRDLQIGRLAAVVVLGLWSGAHEAVAAEKAANPAPKKATLAESLPQPPAFQSIQPHAALQQAAKVVDVPLSGVAFAADGRTGIEVGDAVTALVSLIKGDETQQWAIDLAAVAPDSATATKKAAGREARLFTTSGYEFKFSTERVPLAVRVLGPLEADQLVRKAATAPDVKKARVNVSADYLTLGLERVPKLRLRTLMLRAGNPKLERMNWGMSSRAFPPEVVAKSGKAAAALGFTEADERSLTGSTLALLEFFQTISSTPGLQDVLKAVIDVPWWSIIRSGGKLDVGFSALEVERWQLDALLWGEVGAGREVYTVPLLLSINGKPALALQLAVTTPQPPLGVTAGVVGIAARQPDGKGPLLMLQIVSTRTAGK